MTEDGVQSRLVEAPIVLNPAPQDRIPRARPVSSMALSLRTASRQRRISCRILVIASVLTAGVRLMKNLPH
jgi:hypothetical protein